MEFSSNDPKDQPNHYFDDYEKRKFDERLKLICNRPVYANLKSLLNSKYKDFLLEMASHIASADGYSEQWGGGASDYENAFKGIENDVYNLKEHDFVLNYIYPALETLREHEIFVFEPWDTGFRVTNEYMNLKELKPNQILVFGSNLAGRHGKGLAKESLKLGAVLGIGEGLQGQTYALPTKDEKVKTLPLNEIAKHIETFKQYAQEHPELEFLVTKIGCGLAGYHPIQINPLFGWWDRHTHKNITLPLEFLPL